MSVFCRVLLASAVCKACLKGSLHLFERPSGRGMARTLVLQCANNACRAFTELPTSEKIVSGKARFYDINGRSALAMKIIGRGRASLTKFCAVVIVPALVVLAVEDWTEPRTCVVQHGGHVALIQELNLRIRTISWCQKRNLFEHSSYNCIWNSSSENNRTFYVTSSSISSFNIRPDRLDLPPFSSFKFQVSSRFTFKH